MLVRPTLTIVAAPQQGPHQFFLNLNNVYLEKHYMYWNVKERLPVPFIEKTGM